MMSAVSEIRKFKLSPVFLSQYATREVDWGFGDFSYVVYKRTYARRVEGEDRTEEWWETCRRVIEGMFTTQKAHCHQLRLPWCNRKAQRSAQEAYDRMFNFKWTPSGRGLWMMGTDFVWERSGAGLNNCAFVTTENITGGYSSPFTWMFEMSMLGVGVGYDTKGAGTIEIAEPRRTDEVHYVEDSREGWAESLRILLDAFVGKGAIPVWDFSLVRERGAKIKGFGGVASGPAPLKEMLKRVDEIHMNSVGEKISSTLISDTMNLIAKCVVSGGVRRSALIALGDKDDEEFANLKADHEKLMDYRWASNNSIFASIGMDYSYHAPLAARNGEPNFVFMENVHRFGRTGDPEDNRDAGAMGFNPCAEQPLWDKELCNLVETYPARHDSVEDYLRTLKFAYLYGKTVSLIPTHSPETNAIMMRNRRIGLSMSGVVQNIEKVGLRNHLEMCDVGYKYVKELDKTYSDWLCVPRSIRMTTVKPSGTVSLLPGATPGIHHPISEFYIRRMRIANTSDLWGKLKDAGYHVEDCVNAPDTKVVEFPIRVENFGRAETDVSMWEQVNLVSLMQQYWSDNSVSCTVKITKEEGEELDRVIEAYEDRLKSISFLPHSDHGYEQAPYEPITQEEYESLRKNISPINIGDAKHEVTEKFCDGDTCMV